MEWHGRWADSWEGVQHLTSEGVGLTRAQRADMERMKKKPVPGSMYERITREAGEKRVWCHAQAGGVQP